ncbi:MAG TPA: YXWGXW repeat-containing protein [Noviherbaspirillum sp.]|nr:YXWGXW repeat-containing protein [Noviherbaspirillum sp.]
MKHILCITALVLGSAALAPAVAAPQIGIHVTVGTPPPPVRYEAAPRPHRGHEWIPGYWDWTGRRYVWVPGRWEKARAGHYYRRAEWRQGPRGWTLVRGGWQAHPRPHHVRTPPPPRAYTPHSHGPRR